MLFFKITNKQGEIHHNVNVGDNTVSVGTPEALSYIFTKLLGILN